jgi:ubiquitin-protein ligase
MRLSQSELAARLALDFEAAIALRSPCLIQVLAFADEHSFSGNRPIANGRDAKPARIYRVDYAIRTLSGAGQFIDGCSIKFDLLAKGNYPYSSPLVYAISRPVPWSPHFGSNGAICLGSGWEAARGKMLLAQLIIHVAKLLNFDEPSHGAHLNPGAYAFWQRHCKGRPINPELVYPSLPSNVIDLIHGTKSPLRFAPASSSSKFVHAEALTQTKFIPAARHHQLKNSIGSAFKPRVEAEK